MASQLRLFDGGTGDGEQSAPEPAPVPRVWHVLPYEVEGFGGVTWPRGDVICTTRQRALVLGEFLANRLFFEVVIYEVERETGVILCKWTYRM